MAQEDGRPVGARPSLAPEGGTTYPLQAPYRLGMLIEAGPCRRPMAARAPGLPEQKRKARSYLLATLNL
ncbi:hypothetical protein GCM10023086_17310 [Streptomyces venetus]|uniref:Uncharacterized protein n=1 Tax=Streptomyces venetus TaxID=1701086 RepID=A0ABP8FDW1_9ACTN